MKKWELAGTLLFAILMAISFFGLALPKVQALECNKTGSYPNAVCGWKNWYDPPKVCSEGDPGAQYICCFWNNSQPNQQCVEVSRNKCACGNVRYRCGSSGTPTPTSCSCNPGTCPPGRPANKFMTTMTGQGSVRTCGDPCNPGSRSCDPKSSNTAPSCSMVPASITMNREDAPRQIQLIASDADYGDTVQITKARVVDTAGNLKSCVKLRTLGGGIIENLVVKTGSDNPGSTSQVNTLLVDPSESHGIYDNVSGQSICSGKLEVEIRDIDSDGGGPDVSDYVTCSVNITVTNQAPQLTNVTVLDKDTDVAFRQPGNLVNGSSFFMGSILAQKRASSCNAPLSLTLNPVQCAGPDINPIVTRRNPISIEFTVSDANGADDILQAGIWIQRNAQSSTVTALPVVGGGVRNSIQVLYSEKSSDQFTGFGGRWYFLSRGCIGNSCGPKNIVGSAKQIFAGLALIPERGAYSLPNGNASQSPYQASSYRAWQRVGFPDCLDSVIGCTVAANIPTASNNAANTTASVYANYDWSIAADDNHLLCFKSTQATPTVVNVSTPVVCPADCAACARREGVEAVVGNPNAITFKFGIFFNDNESMAGAQGMAAGGYSVFLNALDKMGVPLGNVTGKGDEGWSKFDKNGNLCVGATCPAGDFAFVYDPIKPTIDSVTWQVVGLSDISALVKMSDAAGGSGVAGVTNRYMYRQETLDGEPLGEREWAKKSSDGTDFDGKNDSLATGAGQITMNGTGLLAGEEIVTGACVYDRAGNMGCGKSGADYIFLAPWVKTSLGDVYSNKTATDPQAFEESLPDANDLTANSSRLYAPFVDQSDTMATGFLMTGTTAFGISGGRLSGGTNYPLGFNGNYRTTAVNVFNLLGNVTKLPGLEFERLQAASQKNCEQMNNTVPNTCVHSTTLSDVSLAMPFKLITAGTQTVTTNLTCVNGNVIFVNGTLTISANVLKAPKSACMFVINAGSTLEITDTPSDGRDYVAGVGYPKVDMFEGAVVSSATGVFKVNKGVRGATSKSTDRLEIHGFIFSADTLPTFKRVLAPVDNRRFPSEWIVYDASMLDVLRPILGTEKTVDLTCGTSNHVLCKTVPD